METTCSTGQNKGTVNTNSQSPYRRQTSSAVLALKKELIMKAAKEKARIQMDLVEKQLAVDIAAVNAKYSPQKLKLNSKCCQDFRKGNERSQQELEGHKASETGITYGSVFPPNSDGTECPVQQLDSALNGMHTTSTSTSRNDNIRSRISAPMEAPELAAERTELLSFYTAAEKTMCNCNLNETVSVLTSITTTLTVMSTSRGNYNQQKLKLKSATQSNAPNVLAPKSTTVPLRLRLSRSSPSVRTISPYMDSYNSLHIGSQKDAATWPLMLEDVLMYDIDPGGIINRRPTGPSPEGVPWERWRDVTNYEDRHMRR